MTRTSVADHWQTVYQGKAGDQVSWFQATPSLSLELLEDIGVGPRTSIIDIGGGTSCLVDNLLERGLSQISVLDISEAALMTSRNRLGDKAELVEWIVADITRWAPTRRFDVWHDRAAFHFLTEASDISAYVERLRSSLKHSGHVIIATFAPDGPDRCSGLPVTRYDSESLQKVLGPGFHLVLAKDDRHLTPWNTEQAFQFNVFRFAP